MDIRRRPPNPKIKVSNLEYAIPHDDSEPRNILEKIVWEKDREVFVARERLPLDQLKSKINDLPKTLGFLNNLKNHKVLPAVIAEIKKASPSRGLLREDFNPIEIAKAYKKGGAACISVLTDKTFFKGGFDVLTQIRDSVDLPILCKDFIINAYQIYQARVSGADAILLIAAILNDQDLIYLYKIASNLDLDVLVEVHNSEEFSRVISLGLFTLIGINNRDLRSFKTDLNVTRDLALEFADELVKKNILLVSESGLFNRQDLQKVFSYGAKAVLIGEALMKKTDIVSALQELQLS